MTTYSYAVSRSVTLDGADISDTVLSATCNLGFSGRVSNCRIEVTSEPAGWSYWNALTFTVGYVGGNVVKRFDGYLVDVSYRNWPASVTLIGKGPLVLAQRVTAPEDAESGGVDLSDGGAGQTDGAIATQVLTACGLTARLGTIGGTARVLGTQASDKFTWKSGQTGLSIIEMLDKISLGYLTYEQLGGEIVRSLVSPLVPNEVTEWTLVRGVDIAAGASSMHSIKQAKNRVIVEGWNDGATKRRAEVTGAHPAAPPGVTYDTLRLSSSWIEREATTDAGDGLACDEVADWLLLENNSRVVEATVPTWRDYAFEPGQALTLTDATLGLDQAVWVRDVTLALSRSGELTQTLTVRALLDKTGRATGSGAGTGTADGEVVE